MLYRDDYSETVYSTEHGRMCPDCGKPVKKCACRKQHSASPGDGVIRVSRETKGRKGKGVTIITGFSVAPDELKKLAKDLKKKCGSGGTVKNGVIEIQGDHRDTLVSVLTALGHTVKKAGG